MSKEKAVNALGWNLAERFGGQLINFVVTAILARILLPKDFGMVALVSALILILQAVVDNGLNQALIRKGPVTQGEYSSVFFISLLFSIVVYFLVFVTAPYLAIFFEQPDLSLLFRVMALRLVVTGLTAVHVTILVKDMNFREHFFVQLPWIVLGGICGVWAALSDFGIWSLVIQQFAWVVPAAIFTWIRVRWRPSFVLELSSLRELHRFGFWLFLAGLINSIFEQIYVFVIGKAFSYADVGYYNRAYTTRQLPINNLSSTLGKITLPLFANMQEDIQKLRAVFRKMMVQVMFMVVPVMVGCAVVGDQIFVLLFTDKWLPAVPLFQILCIAGIFYPLNAYNLNILKITGHSKLFFRIEVGKKILQAAVIAITIWYGLYALVWGQVVYSVASLFINSYYSGRLINYGVFRQLADTLLVFVGAAVMGGVVWALKNAYFYNFSLIDLTVLVAAGTTTYALYNIAIKAEPWLEMVQIVKQRLMIKR